MKVKTFMAVEITVTKKELRILFELLVLLILLILF